MYDYEIVLNFCAKLHINYQEIVATVAMKIEFNMDVVDRYQAERVILLPGSAYFFDACGELLGIGAYDGDGDGFYTRKKEKD